MRKYKIKETHHIVYDDMSEVPNGILVKDDWHLGNKNDWVKADDGAVMKVIRSGSMKGGTNYIGTCTGTFLCKKGVIFDSSRRKNIYSFGRDKNHYDSINDREKTNYKEVLFASYVAHGMKPVDAYLKAFKTKDRTYASKRSAILVRQERIIMAVKEELESVFKKLNINLEYLVEKAKIELETSDRGADRLKALSMLWDAADVVPKQTKVTQVSGAFFQGFDQKALEDIQRPLIED